MSRKARNKDYASGKPDFMDYVFNADEAYRRKQRHDRMLERNSNLSKKIAAEMNYLVASQRGSSFE
ncbi:MAG: hypothetical protein Q8L47_02830 [bacterium]|nr:hypothetical protein [bacterium]